MVWFALLECCCERREQEKLLLLSSMSQEFGKSWKEKTPEPRGSKKTPKISVARSP